MSLSVWTLDDGTFQLDGEQLLLDGLLLDDVQDSVIRRTVRWRPGRGGLVNTNEGESG